MGIVLETGGGHPAQAKASAVAFALEPGIHKFVADPLAGAQLDILVAQFQIQVHPAGVGVIESGIAE